MSAIELKSELFEKRRLIPLDIPPSSLNEGIPNIDRWFTEHLDFEGVIGIDFGTSKTKIVISEKNTVPQKQYPVAFYQEKNETIENYLLPSFLIKNDKTEELLLPCQLKSLEGYSEIRDIKSRLLFGNTEEKELAFLESIAYVALCIRHARAWFHFEHSSKWSKKPNSTWRINLGMPNKLFEPNEATFDYSLICHAAILLSNFPDAKAITLSWVKFILSYIFVNKLSPLYLEENYFCEGAVIPELAAQLLAVTLATKGGWDDNKHKLLIDIGAGTTDIAFFYHRPSSSDVDGVSSTSIHYHEVLNAGVEKLHNNRLNSFIINKDSFNFSKDTLRLLRDNRSTELPELPITVQDYVKKGTVSGQAHALFSRIDDEAINDYRGLVVRALTKSNIEKPALSEYEIPTFICGGGARIAPFKNIQSIISNTPNFKTICLAHPRKLNIPVIGELRNSSNLDRLSVAYGLSLAYQGIDSIGHFNIVREGKRRDDPDEFLDIGNEEFFNKMKNTVFDSSIFKHITSSPTIKIAQVPTSDKKPSYLSIFLPFFHPSISSEGVNLYLCSKACYPSILDNAGPNYAVFLLQDNELSAVDSELALGDCSGDKFLILTSTSKCLDFQELILYIKSTLGVNDRFRLFLHNSLFETLFSGLLSLFDLLNLRFKDNPTDPAELGAASLKNSEPIPYISDSIAIPAVKTENISVSNGKFQVIYGENNIERFDSYRGAVAKFFTHLFEGIEDPHAFLLSHMQMPEFKKYQTTINNSIHFLHPTSDKETKRRQSEKIKGTESWYWAINKKPREIESCLNLLAFYKHKSNYLSINLAKK